MRARERERERGREREKEIHRTMEGERGGTGGRVMKNLDENNTAAISTCWHVFGAADWLQTAW